jgi:branched-chain amino acid transport system ATP-binding protein
MLELKNVCIYYKKHVAVRNLSLSVNQGDIITILGANGAGKTSTLNAISGIIKLRKKAGEEGLSGEIYFKGKRISGKSAANIASLGIIQVPEGRRIFPLLTVRENLQVGAYLRKNDGEIHKTMEKALALFPDLKDKLKAKGRELSGGQQQMLAIARGLMAQPEVLLFDEPSLGLSPVHRHQLAEKIKEINSEGTTVVLVEQNARLGLMLASYGYVLENGKLALEGKTADLLNNEDVKKAYLGV